MASEHPRTCPLCEATCGLVIHTDGERVTKVRGDALDPFSRGYICPKGVALGEIREDPDRIRRPRRRSGDRWTEVGWDEALDEAATRLRTIQKLHGMDAVAVYLGNPTVHNLGAMLCVPDLVRALRTKNRFSATSVDQLAHHMASWSMFGHQLLLPIPDIDHTDFFLIVGGNPIASNGSLMTVPDVRNRLAAIGQRGGRVVVVDPRRGETASIADQHLFIRPGSDVFLFLALLHVIFAERLDAPGRLASFTDGLDSIRAAVSEWSPARAAELTGIPAGELAALARAFARAPSAVAHARMGASTQAHGGLCQWLVQVLNIVTGNLDRPGGALFATPALDALAHMGRGHLGKWRSRVRGLPEFGGELPVAALAEEIDTPGEGSVRALLTHAGNPVLSTPNGRRLERAIASLDFFVAIDFYCNETTRHAHLILPPTEPLEHAHYDLAFYLLSVRNFARWSDPVFPRAQGALHDHEILSGLIGRLLRDGPPMHRLAARANAWLGPERLVDLGLRTGPHGIRRGLRGLSVARLRKNPHGIDLGPLEPRLPARLFTRDRRIDAAPRLFLDALASLESSAPARSGLLLIGRRHLRSNNSWMHNIAGLATGKNRCTAQMNPEDAAARGIEAGSLVRVRSRVGEVELPAEVTDAIMPGVISIPHGWGHDRPGVSLEVASQHAGASINDLTDDQRTDPLTGAAAFSGTPVEVEPAARQARSDRRL
jgi:anaerobic selenocysteine-containing dehydrogenase